MQSSTVTRAIACPLQTAMGEFDHAINTLCGDFKSFAAKVAYPPKMCRIKSGVGSHLVERLAPDSSIH